VRDGVQMWACVACAEILAPRSDLPAIAAAMLRSKRRPGVCPNCGTQQADALETGLVGCPLCYEMFDDIALSHFGIARGGWTEVKTWSLHLP
jgi:protein-arginine kinase activator protein McsA